ncbi:MAG TPA: hypothetical protein VNA69_06670 [Thermoanaerobaculia bacterium]|nr:hypothetical protein [Thermoanaerobaculia bacterium]
MKRIIVIAILSIVVLNACTTRLTVRKATDSTPGIRYYLPRPVLVAKPQTDGSVLFTMEYLPDTSQEYAIEAESYVAKHKLRVETEASGILKKVQWNPTSTEVASQLASSIGEAAKAELTRRDAEETAEKTAADAKKKTVEDAKAAVQKLRDELAALDAKIAALESFNKDATEAKVERAVTAVKLQIAIDHLGEVISTNTVGGAGNVAASKAAAEEKKKKVEAATAEVDASTSSLKTIGAKIAGLESLKSDTAAATAERVTATARLKKALENLDLLTRNKPAFDQAWAPVLFVIKEGVNAQNKPTVYFQAVNEQQQLGTSKKPEAKAAPVNVELRLKDGGVIRPAPNTNALQLIVVPRPSVHAIDASKVTVLDVANAANPKRVANAVMIATLTDANVIVVDLDSALPKGSYVLTVPFHATAKADKDSRDVPFVVER